MKIKNITIRILLAIAICITSCTNKDETLLTVSKTNLSFPKEAAAETVEVNTSETKWSAITVVNWVNLKKSGKRLTINVLENVTTSERKTKVMVLGAGIDQAIEIVQSASEPKVIALPDSLKIDQQGGRHKFYIQTNMSNWTATSNANWISVMPKPYKNELVVDIAENKKKLPRKATLTITSGEVIAHVTIHQKKAMYYFLPCLEFGANPFTIAEFENARQSTSLGNGNYLTISPAFSRIMYVFSKKGLFVETKMFAQSSDIILHEDFDRFMTDNQFRLISFVPDRTSKLYELDKNNYFIEAIAKTKKTCEVTFNKIPNQPKAYPTFKKLPYAMNNFTANTEKIKAWEKSKGGKFNKELSNSDLLYFDVNEKTWVCNRYWMNIKDIVYRIDCAFSNLTLAFYKIDNESYLTREFRTLLAKEGFFLVEIENTPWTPNKIYRYENDAKKRIIEISISDYIPNQKSLLCISIFAKR